MPKQADYLVSGLWKSDGVVTHYLIHEMTGDNAWNHGEKKTVAQVIALVESNKTLKTVRWRYQQVDWSIGASVHVVNANPKYLRTNAGGIISDNLANLIRVNAVA